MVDGDWHELVEQLRGSAYQFGLVTPDSPVHRVEFDTGLTDVEVAAAEGRYGFRFPPDLRGVPSDGAPERAAVPGLAFG